MVLKLTQFRQTKGLIVTILFYADPFFRDGVLSNATEPAHFVADGVAVGLMLSGLVLVLSRNRIKSAVAAVALALMATAVAITSLRPTNLGEILACYRTSRISGLSI